MRSTNVKGIEKKEQIFAEERANPSWQRTFLEEGFQRATEADCDTALQTLESGIRKMNVREQLLVFTTVHL